MRQRPLDLQWPRPRRPAWPAALASVLGHAAALALALVLAGERSPLLLRPTPAPERTVLIAPLPAPDVPQAAGVAPAPGRAPARGQAAAMDVVQPRGGDTARGATDVRAPGGRDAGTAGRLGADLASGRLWQRYEPTAEDVAAELALSHGQKVDSATTAIIQAFLDSVAADPATRALAPPRWTTDIAGATFGLDAKWIYVAGLKIPTALLALLPLPAAGNEQKAFDRSAWLYEDLRYAAQRAENLEEFKRAIADIRERKDAEREFERNRRTAPEPEPDRETMQPLAP